MKCERYKYLFAAILKHRHEPLVPHHTGAIKELLNYPTDDDLDKIILGGAEQNPSANVGSPVEVSGESVGLQDGGEVEPIRIGVEEKDFIEMLNVIHRLIEPKSVYCENREEQLDETIQSMIKNAHLIKEILDRTWPHYVLGGEF